MARTRSSSYGNMLGQLPDWVFGGEFGDISNLLNNREQEYQQTRGAETTNDMREIALEEQRRQQRMDEEMRNSDIFAGEKQPTLGEMYDTKRKIAMQYGSIDDVLGIEKELAQIKAAQEKQARDQAEQSRKDQKWNWEIEDRKKGRGSDRGDGEIKGTTTLISPDGSPELIKKSEYNAKIKAGYRDPDLENALLLSPSLNKKSSGASGSWLPWADSSTAPPSSTPSAKGDTARQAPAPGDQVAMITRKRAKAVKGE